ncbi:MAG: NAD(P)H-dependent oxidoreductase [Desulfomonile tiedjei]|nr:NAD(P)H-dependent oxidoreductase [Desulfomonile tiedjei]
MNILVIYAHPGETSFNKAIADTVVRTLRSNRHEVIFHDLYKEAFDPILLEGETPKGASLDQAIEKHCAELSAAEGIAIVHPNWWGQPPAILKGWVDRVFRPGVAYEFQEGDAGEGIPVGLLKAKAAIVLNTSNTSMSRELEAFGDPLETLWKNCIFDLCGVRNFHRRMFTVIVTSTPEQREDWLREVADLIEKHFPGD